MLIVHPIAFLIWAFGTESVNLSLTWKFELPTPIPIPVLVLSCRKHLTVSHIKSFAIPKDLKQQSKVSPQQRKRIAPLSLFCQFGLEH